MAKNIGGERDNHEFRGLKLELSSLAVQGFGRLSKLVCLHTKDTGALDQCS